MKKNRVIYKSIAELLKKDYLPFGLNKNDNQIYLYSFIELSNHCQYDCFYCRRRKTNNALGRFRLGKDIVLQRALEIQALGYNYLILKMAQDEFYAPEYLACLIREIKEQTNLTILLAMGYREEKEYKLWHQAGAVGYLLEYQGLNPGFDCKTPATISTMPQHIKLLHKIGYSVGWEFYLGLPGQNYVNLAQDLILLQYYGLECLTIHLPEVKTKSIFSQSRTPLCCRLLALARFLRPKLAILVPEAIARYGGETARLQALKVGANGLCCNVTPLPEYYSFQPDGEWWGEHKPPELSWQKARHIIDHIGKKVYRQPSLYIVSS